LNPTLTITFNKVPSISPPMIVCHCHAVTDREIRACVREGARTSADVAAACGACTGCGGCEELVDELVAGEHRHLTLVRDEAAA
jgi:bacterioferritin-associated ferredoxin